MGRTETRTREAAARAAERAEKHVAVLLDAVERASDPDAWPAVADAHERVAVSSVPLVLYYSRVAAGESLPARPRARKPRRLAKALERHPRSEIRRRLAKAHAQARGHKGADGGWIYSAKGRPICQGWESYYRLRRLAIWRELLGDDEAGDLVGRARARERDLERRVAADFTPAPAWRHVRLA